MPRQLCPLGALNRQVPNKLLSFYSLERLVEDLFIFQQAYTILPLLPLVYPVLWIGVTLYGTARLRVLFEMYTKRHSEVTEAEHISLEHVNCPRVMWSFWYMVLGHPQGMLQSLCGNTKN